MTPTPTTFEAAQSLLTLAIHHIERNPPRNADDLGRLRLAVSNVDTLTSRASRAIELEKTT